jgi:hypothetical protein
MSASLAGRRISRSAPGLQSPASGNIRNTEAGLETGCGTGVPPSTARRILQVRLEIRGEFDVAGYADLIGRNAALEKVCEFLDVLKLHERERITRAVDRR